MTLIVGNEEIDQIPTVETAIDGIARSDKFDES
jgi:hypothetical protein